MTYTYQRTTDGTDAAFEIVDSTGAYVAHICFWDEEERAEADARKIVAALNAFTSNSA